MTSTPRTGSSASFDSTKLVAVLLDIENFVYACKAAHIRPDIAPVITTLRSQGNIGPRLSWGDVLGLPRSIFPYEIRQNLHSNGFAHVDMPHTGHAYSKNSADIALAVNAITLASQRPDITTFAIISNDRDFLPLVWKLRELGKTVVGVFSRSMALNDTVLAAFNEIVTYGPEETVAAVTPVTPKEAPTTPDEEPYLPDEIAPLPDDGPWANVEPQKAQEMLRAILTIVVTAHQNHCNCTESYIENELDQRYPDLNWHKEFSSLSLMLHAMEQGTHQIVVIRRPHGLLVEPAGAERPPAPAILKAPTPAKPEKAAKPTAPEPVTTASIPMLIEEYMKWAQRKMRSPIMRLSRRILVCEAILTVFEENPKFAISMRELSSKASMLAGCSENEAFRIVNGLVKGNVIPVERRNLADPFNHHVCSQGLTQTAPQLNKAWERNLVLTFKLDQSHSLPFNEDVWGSLLGLDDFSAKSLHHAISPKVTMAKAA